jgi:tRNA(fMet)-specific endonuclease VapC
MAANRLVVDTSVFIEHLRARDKSKSSLFMLGRETEIVVSSITVYELYCGSKSPEKWLDVSTILTNLPVIPFDESCAKQASLIYHELISKNKIIEVRDILIAASSIAIQIPLMTLNKKHFDRIKGIQLA